MSRLHVDCNRVVRRLHTQSNANRNGHYYSFGNTDSNCNSHRYFDGETYAYATLSAFAEAASDASAAPEPITLAGTRRSN